MRPRLHRIRAQAGADGAFLNDLEWRRQRTCAQQNRQVGSFFNIEITGDNTRSTRDVALDRGCRNHFVVQHDRKGTADIFKRIVTKFACRRGVEPECDSRTPVLVKIQLRVFKVFARDNGAWRIPEET